MIIYKCIVCKTEFKELDDGEEKTSISSGLCGKKCKDESKRLTKESSKKVKK